MFSSNASVLAFSSLKWSHLRLLLHFLLAIRLDSTFSRRSEIEPVFSDLETDIERVDLVVKLIEQ